MASSQHLLGPIIGVEPNPQPRHSRRQHQPAIPNNLEAQSDADRRPADGSTTSPPPIMSFNRRRVALACAFCRHRKRRCDAARPACRNCVEADVDCQYDDTPSQRIDSSGGSREIIGRLQEIEAMLQHHLPGISTLATGIQALISQSASAIAAASPASQASTLQAARILSHDLAGAGAVPAGSRSSWSLPLHHLDHPQPELSGVADPELAPLTIPVGHKTSSNYLLRLPPMQQLIGEYPPDLFFLLESRNPLPPDLPAHPSPRPSNPLTAAELDREVLDCLVSAYFAEAYHCHPILDHDEFHRIYHGFLDNYYADPWSIESVLCLVVFAMGAATLAPPGAQGFHDNPPGMAYMQAALPTLISMSSWSVSYSLLLPQALVLASVYFAYITRPLQSWRLVYSASSLLQFKLCRLSSRDGDPAGRETILRLFWSCFLVECDRLAELELPQSGLQQLIDQTSLPSFTGVDSSQSTAYLAEISIRRLLNRVHNSLYPRKQSVLSLSSTSLTAVDEFSAAEIASVTSVCDELHRQLNSWYESIPEPFRPSLGTEPTGNDRETVLRIRYYAARHIIHRPFVLYIVTHDLQHVSNAAILEKAGVCIESCRAYLHNTSEILSKQSQYTWTFSLSSLGALVVLTLASRNPALCHLVPDIDDLQTLAVNNVRPWAYRGSSLETVVSVMEEMQRKQRLFLACI